MKTMWKRLKQSVAGAPPVPETLTLTDPKTIAQFKSLSADLRSHNPVCPVSGGGVLLLDPDDVMQALSNPALSNQPSRFSALAAKNKDRYVAASVAANILPFLDGPRHVALRQWASRAFFQNLRRFEDEIAAIAEHHIAQMQVSTSYPLVEDIARNFVVDVIGRFIGIHLSPEETKRYTASLFRLFAPAADAATFAKTNEGLAQARLRFTDALAERRADHAASLLATLDVTFPEDLDQTDKDLVIIDNALLFLADGVENVEAAIGVAMMRHAQAPALITPDFVRQAIHDDTPGQTIARIAAKDIAIGGETLGAGTPVFLSLASANDGATSDDAFTFGRGRHKCIGENLAIAMVTALCSALVSRDPAINAEALSYSAMFGHKWPRDIAVTLRR